MFQRVSSQTDASTATCYKQIFVGFNEVCSEGLCQCIRNSEGDCLGPFNYCPSYSQSPGSCHDEVAGSVCIEERNTCECMEGQAEIARTCINTTG